MRPGEPAVDLTVCPNQRLYAAYIYSDDPVFIIVGVQRALRGLRVWRRLTTEARLIMADPQKRHLGTYAPWLGVVIMATLGIVVVPTAKLLHAAGTIKAQLVTGTEFHIYRSLCGLLEHLRAVNVHGRNVMHGLYRPHAQLGDALDGPTAM
eukprot:3744999-Prymnesium_polylepis.1